MNEFSDIESRSGKKLRPAPIGNKFGRADRKALLEESLRSPTAAVVAQKRSTRTNWISLGLGLGLAAAAGFLVLARVNDKQPAKNQPNVAVVETSALTNARYSCDDQSRAHDSFRFDRGCLPHA